MPPLTKKGGLGRGRRRDLRLFIHAGQNTSRTVAEEEMGAGYACINEKRPDVSIGALLYSFVCRACRLEQVRSFHREAELISLHVVSTTTLREAFFAGLGIAHLNPGQEVLPDVEVDRAGEGKQVCAAS